MKRRDLGRYVAVAVGGAGATLAGLAATDDATAQAALTLDITGDSATLGAEESVTALTLSVDVNWQYDLPDSAAPDTAIVELAAATGDAEPQVVASAESAQLFVENEGAESFNVGLLGEVVDADALAPASGSQETTVTVVARLRVEDGDGAVLARANARDTAPVTVERDAAASEYGAVGGSGSLTIATG